MESGRGGGSLVSFNKGSSKIISLGAEAVLLKIDWFGLPAIKKVRISKNYRNPLLDRVIRSRRTVLESRLLMEAHIRGVPTPVIYDVKPQEYSIIMEYVDGVKLRDILKDLPLERQLDVFFDIGYYSGILHENGICHGDLTTSNILYVKQLDKICFIDFGLGTFSRELEDIGVDIHLFLRSLESVHYNVVDKAFPNFLEGYKSVRGEKETLNALRKVKEIRSRGRYVAERKTREILK